MAKATKNQLIRKRSRKPARTILRSPGYEKIVAEERGLVDMPGSASIEDARNPITDSFELPATYGITGITLVARDPYWIYAYWDISQASFEEAKKALGLDFSHAKMTLRMYDVTCIEFNGENANSSFDLDVGHARNWCINLWRDNVSYCAEIGMKTLTGRFHSFARSNVASTPRANMSWRREEIWMKVTDKDVKAPFANYDISRTGPKEGNDTGNTSATRQEIKPEARSQNSDAAEAKVQGAKAAEVKKILAEDPCPVSRSRRAKRIFLTDDDIKAYYYGLSPALREIMLGRNKKRDSAYGIGSECFHLKFNNPSLTEILLGKEGASKRLPAGSSAELTASEIAPGASENLARGASEHMPGARGRRFFFEIGTELIVYGRTEPDAMVLLGDKKVALRPDGTFSMRFALPDGKVPLDFAAISGDRVERREIATAVDRSKTQYNP